jgi:hypothetical protein
MIERTRFIDFDPQAIETRGVWVGPFASNKAVIDACIPMTRESSKWPEYEAWAVVRDVDPETGDILVPFENPELMGRGDETQKGQLEHAANGGKAKDYTKLNYKISPDLELAFKKAKPKPGSAAFTVLSFAMTRETLSIYLAEAHSDLNVQFTSAVTRKKYAGTRNALIQTTAPEIAEKRILNYTSNPLGKFNLVHINSWLHNLVTDEQLDEFYQQVASTEADQVAMSNTLTSHGDASEYWFQAMQGGGIVDRADSADSIIGRMEKIGYSLAFRSNDPATYDKRTVPDPDKPAPVTEHFLFERK